MNAYETSLTYTRLMRVALTTMLAIGLSACGDDDPAPGAGSNSVTITVNADQSQEVPATGSGATATGSLTLNQDTGELTGSMTATGITITAAHIHDGFAGTNGSVVVPLTINGTEISVPAATQLDANQRQALLLGQYYVNLHSAAFAPGEIRGQILPTGISVLSASLDGAQEVPSVTTGASGAGAVTVNQNDSTISAAINTTGVDDATAAHVHSGAAGANGPVIVGLTKDTGDPGLWTVVSATVSAADLASILAGDTYFNVHTPAVGSGEIRGQITP